MKRFLSSSLFLWLAVQFIVLWTALIDENQICDIEYKQWMLVFLYAGCLCATGWLMDILEWHRKKCEKANKA